MLLGYGRLISVAIKFDPLLMAEQEFRDARFHNYSHKRRRDFRNECERSSAELRDKMP
jgi:hypothetical protein